MKYNKNMLIAYFVIIIIFSIYTYALVDPNLTLIAHPLWEIFRNHMVILGYYNRPISVIIYVTGIALLFLFHIYFMRSKKKLDVMRIGLIIALITLCAYPLLSHDLFNYMFTGKIVTYYHANPYVMRALDYPHDNWTRFMHWTHVTYPYGPTFLPLLLIPSLIGFSKFSITFILYKVFFATFYLISVYYLGKLNKWAALFFATNPLVIVEALINNHNDIVTVGIAIAGIYALHTSKVKTGKLLMLISGGIKYITLPLLLAGKPQGKLTRNSLLAIIGFTIVIVVACFKNGPYPWYFLNFFILLPYLGKRMKDFSILSFGLLLSYYPFIALGEWDNFKLSISHNIFEVALIINCAYILYLYRSNLRRLKYGIKPIRKK